VQLQQLGFRCRKIEENCANPKAWTVRAGAWAVLSLDFTIQNSPINQAMSNLLPQQIFISPGYLDP